MKHSEFIKTLQLFGDGLEHTWLETVFLGTLYNKVRQHAFEKMFRRCLEYGLLQRVWKAPFFEGDSFIITSRGDKALRDDMIRRGGDVSYYKYFDRSLSSPNGLSKYTTKD